MRLKLFLYSEIDGVLGQAVSVSPIPQKSCVSALFHDEDEEPGRRPRASHPLRRAPRGQVGYGLAGQQANPLHVDWPPGQSCGSFAPVIERPAAVPMSAACCVSAISSWQVTPSPTLL